MPGMAPPPPGAYIPAGPPFMQPMPYPHMPPNGKDACSTCRSVSVLILVCNQRCTLVLLWVKCLVSHFQPLFRERILMLLIAPQAYMQQAPPPGAYPVPPNGAGPRPSMPPTPIPSHAHPYYQQSPQRTYLAHRTFSFVLISSSSATCCPLPDDDASSGTPSFVRSLPGSACAYGRRRPCLNPPCSAGRCAQSHCPPRCSLLLTMWRSLRCSVTRARGMVTCVLSLRSVLSSGCHVMLFAAICCDAMQTTKSAPCVMDVSVLMHGKYR